MNSKRLSINFNPRTHEGCDPLSYVRQLHNHLFQSTHPRRVRQGPPCICLTACLISIHAPTKGATLHDVIQQGFTVNFNPRTHEGCDSISSTEGATPPNFNPRTHEGCDKTSPLPSVLPQISIHAPTKGATIAKRFNLICSLFQSTHPRRVRRIRFCR